MSAATTDPQPLWQRLLADVTDGTQPAGPALLLDVVTGWRAGHRIPVSATGPVQLDPTAEVLGERGVPTRWDLLDGEGARPLPQDPEMSWPDGAHLVLGNTRLALRRSGQQVPAALTATRAGTVLVNRAPSVRAGEEPVEVALPQAPPGAPRPPVPWAVLVVPLLVGLPVALWWRQPVFAVLALLGPLVTLSQYLLDRRRRRAEQAEATAAYAQESARCTERISALRTERTRSLHRRHPDLAVIAATAGRYEDCPGADLWHRRAWTPGWLTVRLGLGEVDSGCSTVHHGRREPVRLFDAPVTVDLERERVLGICGPARLRAAMLDAVVGQLAVHTSPHQLRVRPVDDPAAPCAASNPRRWDGLPHLADPSAPPEPATAPDATEPAAAHLVVLTDAPAARRRPEVARLLSGPSPLVVALAERREELPLECRSVVELAEPAAGPTPGASSPAAASAILHTDGTAPLPFTPDLPAPDWAPALVALVRPLRDATPSAVTGLPDRVDLLDLLELDPARLAERWLATDAAPQEHGWSVPLGRDERGVWWLDLVRDGPHVLVAGTTGAGKSELLTALVAGLAGTASPQRLGVLLVDYKGGTAFAALAGLPHVTAVVTDLDGAGARRVLTSLTAELRRRERLAVTGGPPPARLVVVVDEFRVLAEEQPDLLSGLVRVATVGRGLGVHLVLATQRPSGVVGPQIQANTNLRIALRVRDEADSAEVVESPLAARITADQPGRALLRSGGGPLRRVQTGYLGADATTRWLATVQAAAALLGRPAARPPCLPPLPERITPDALPDDGSDDAGAFAPGYALADLPEEQRRAVLRWRPGRDGQLAVVGGPGSGRSTTLRALAQAAVRAEDAGSPPVHLHILDAAATLAGPVRRGGLADVGWPQLGTVVVADDTERCHRLLARLEGLLRPGQPAPLAVLLLVDGWESLVECWSRLDHGRAVDHLLRLARDGGRAGLYVAAAGGKALLGGAAAAVFTERVLLPTADETTAMLAGLAPADLPRPWPPGRAIALRRGSAPVTAQVAWPEVMTAADAVRSTAPPTQPVRLAALPARVSRAHLPRTAFAVGGDDAAPVAVPATPALLVCGPAGSGRSTTLAALAGALRATGTAVVWDGEGDPSAAGLRAALAAVADPVLLLDAGWAERPGVEEVATAHLASGPGRRLRLVVTASSTEAILTHRGLLGRVRGLRAGLLLGARGAGDPPVLGPRLPPLDAPPPGRGALVLADAWIPVQVASGRIGRTCGQDPSIPGRSCGEQ